MKNDLAWQPSKFVYKRNHLTASNVPGSVRPGSRLMASRIAAQYDRYIPRFCRGRLADLGCGRVPLYAAYREHVSSVLCADWVDKDSGGYIDVRCDLSGSLPFQTASFDTLILSDVLEHIPQPDVTWREMARILDESGHALISVPFLYPLHEVPYDYYRYTEHALRRSAAEAGFEVLVLNQLGGPLEVLADITAKHLALVKRIGPGLARALQSAADTVSRTGLGRRIGAVTASEFPLGYFVVVRRSSES